MYLQGSPGLPGGVGQPGAVGEKVRKELEPARDGGDKAARGPSSLPVSGTIASCFLCLSQGEPGDTGDAGPPGVPGIPVSLYRTLPCTRGTADLEQACQATMTSRRFLEHPGPRHLPLVILMKDAPHSQKISGSLCTCLYNLPTVQGCRSEETARGLNPSDKP